MNKPIGVIVTGSAGRMGSLVIKAIFEDKNFELVGAIEHSASLNLGTDLPNGISITSDLHSVIDQADVIIDFSVASATLTHIQSASHHKKPMVIGTTGFTDEQRKKLLTYAKSIPIVFSPNMSLGMNVVFEVVKQIQKLLPDYDIAVVEAHHRWKKDAPSGTALKILDILKPNETNPKAQPIEAHALRIGEIAGEHTIYFAGPGERIEVTHRAQSRDAFAIGALKAARFVIHARPGSYGMNDVLGLGK